MPSTIRDVAQRAGVSISTVSRVLNNTAAVDPAKRERVEEAARALGYRPNPAALRLLGRRTGGIGVLLPYVAGDFFSAFLHGIDRVTSDRGYFLIVSSTHRDVSKFEAVARELDQRVDGMIVMSTEADASTVCEWLPPTLPLVFANTELGGASAEAVNLDNWGGAFRLTEHLIGQGHRDIAFLRGPGGAHDGQQRLRGYRDALAAHGLSPALEIEGDYTMEAGLAAVPPLLAAVPRPSALFAANDLSAFGALTGLREAGVRVPEDLALAGFDDIPLAEFAAPPLTTVHAPAREMGEHAISRLLRRLEAKQPPPPAHTLLQTDVIIRASTGKS